MKDQPSGCGADAFLMAVLLIVIAALVAWALVRTGGEPGSQPQPFPERIEPKPVPQGFSPQ
jgi:hypothetical protein